MTSAIGPRRSRVPPGACRRPIVGPAPRPSGPRSARRPGGGIRRPRLPPAVDPVRRWQSGPVALPRPGDELRERADARGAFDEQPGLLTQLGTQTVPPDGVLGEPEGDLQIFVLVLAVRPATPMCS